MQAVISSIEHEEEKQLPTSEQHEGIITLVQFKVLKQNKGCLIMRNFKSI